MIPEVTGIACLSSCLSQETHPLRRSGWGRGRYRVDVKRTLFRRPHWTESIKILEIKRCSHRGLKIKYFLHRTGSYINTFLLYVFNGLLKCKTLYVCFICKNFIVYAIIIFIFKITKEVP